MPPAPGFFAPSDFRPPVLNAEISQSGNSKKDKKQIYHSSWTKLVRRYRWGFRVRMETLTIVFLYGASDGMKISADIFNFNGEKPWIVTVRTRDAVSIGSSLMGEVWQKKNINTHKRKCLDPCHKDVFGLLKETWKKGSAYMQQYTCIYIYVFFLFFW